MITGQLKVYKYDTHIIYPILNKPMKGLEKQKHCEKGHKLSGKVFSEYCESQTGFCDGIPRAVYQVLQKLERSN